MSLNNSVSVLTTLLLLVSIYQGCGQSFSLLNNQSDNIQSSLSMEGHSGTKLYATHCASCHSPLSESTKLGRNFAQIMSAIDSVPNMATLSHLTDPEVRAIAEVLNTDTNAIDGITHIPGKYLPTAKAYDCDPAKIGLSNSGTRRLTRKQMVNSLNYLFQGTGVMSQNPVLTAVELLPFDADIELVDSFDNSISYVEGLFTLTDRITDYVFANQNRINRLLPGCGSSPESNACHDSLFQFAHRAHRRPLPVAQQQDYVAFMQSLSNPRVALKYAVIRILMSPQFHNHFEIKGSENSADKIKIDAFEVASRLSFGITNYPPDDELLRAAAQGRLSNLKQIEQQAARLIETPQAKEYFFEFLISMMRLETSVDPVPAMKNALGIEPQDISLEMTEEFRRYVTHVAFDNSGSFFDLLNAPVIFPYTERLANYFHTSPSDQPVPGSPNRAGILMRPLATKSGSLKSALIPRGVLMRQQLLCANLPSPNANVIDSRLKEIEEMSPLDYSNREIVAHVTSPQSCMGCHNQINPLGYAMESFGPFGEYRQKESVFDANGAIRASHSIDTEVREVLIPGRAPSNVSSSKELAEVLGDSPSSMRCFSQQMFRFTRLRDAQQADGCSLNESANALINGGSIKEGIIKGVVNEEIFWRSSF